MIDKDVVSRVARLSRLTLNETELEEHLEQFQRILGMMDELASIDTEGVEPLNHVLEMENVMREDVVQDSMPPEKILANAPEEMQQMFRVPKIV